MNISTALIIIAALVILAVLVRIIMRDRQRHSYALHTRFGPEYDRQVHIHGSRRRAESELERRAERVKSYAIHPLADDQRARFAEQWRGVQARFVDDPAAAVREADRLVDEVMRARGYPMSEFEERAADLSVDHSRVVEHYRAARTIVTRLERNSANTEDLRQAMVHYRALFEDLLEQSVNMPVR